MTSDLIGINSNFGDSATISGSCGTTKSVCREYKGVNKGNGESAKLDTTDSCLGAQGKLKALPACAADGSAPTVAEPAPTAAPSSTKAATTKAATTAKVTSAAAVPTTLVTKTKTTKSSTKTTTTKAAQATATKDAATGTVQKYAQCGGAGYTGATACVSGAKCTKQNEWYSQCL